ncbi:MAG: hypothetical protein ACRDYA_15330 [Egibacteraceae bacterium]
MGLFRMLFRRMAISAVVAMLMLMFCPGIASASVFQAVDLEAPGGQLTGTLMWTGLYSFELHNMALMDTACDRQPLFFSVSYNGHTGPLHYNNSGCATTTSFPTLEGADTSEISSVTINVCRGVPALQCEKLVYNSL